MRNLTTHLKLAVAMLAALLVFSACNSGQSTDDALSSGIVIDPATSTGSVSADDADGNAMLGDIPVAAYVDSSTRAIVNNRVDVLDSPDGRIIATLDATTEFGTTRVMLVEEERQGWVKVRLPIRPNHRTGWVPASSVELEPIEFAVYVDLQARTLSVQAGDELLLRSPVAVGTDENPTPTGTFYVTDKLETPDPGGAYGPYALGLSGHSETLTEFAGGDGQIGIHGTDDPTSIGQPVSHGCVRLANDVIEELAQLLPLGTPVHVV